MNEPTMVIVTGVGRHDIRLMTADERANLATVRSEHAAMLAELAQRTQRGHDRQAGAIAAAVAAAVPAADHATVHAAALAALTERGTPNEHV